jgi:hypothetical protein
MGFTDLKNNFRRRFAPNQDDKLKMLAEKEAELIEKEKYLNARLKIAEKEAELNKKIEKIKKNTPPSKMQALAKGVMQVIQKGAENVNRNIAASNGVSRPSGVGKEKLEEWNKHSEEILGLKPKVVKQ